MVSPRNNADEDADFRRAVADAEPLEQPKRVVDHRRPAPVPRQRLRDEGAALAESLHGPLSVDDALDAGNELAYLREGLQREVLRKLRRGHWVVEAELDLHGMNRHVAAVSVGIVDGEARLDLDYAEDFLAHTDMNVVMVEDGRFIELQATAEREPLGREQLDQLLGLAGKGVRELITYQKRAINALV